MGQITKLFYRLSGKKAYDERIAMLNKKCGEGLPAKHVEHGKMIAAMTNRYCAVSMSKCREDCNHFAKGGVIITEAFMDAYNVAYTISPKCRLWK